LAPARFLPGRFPLRQDGSWDSSAVPLIEGILQVPELEAVLLAPLNRPGWTSLRPHERDLLVRLALAAFVVTFILNRLRLPRSLDPDAVAAVVPALGPTAAWIRLRSGLPRRWGAEQAGRDDSGGPAAPAWCRVMSAAAVDFCTLRTLYMALEHVVPLGGRPYSSPAALRRLPGALEASTPRRLTWLARRRERAAETRG